MSCEFKPCPFCGRQPRLTTRPAAEVEGGGWLSFLACHCGGYSARAHQFAKGTTAKDARDAVMAKWNTRYVEQ